jgi:hypothetical protein
MAEEGRAQLRNVAPPAPEERDAGGTRTALFSGRSTSRLRLRGRTPYARECTQV